VLLNSVVSQKSGHELGGASAMLAKAGTKSPRQPHEHGHEHAHVIEFAVVDETDPVTFVSMFYRS
jgi:hypothetical protein